MIATFGAGGACTMLVDDHTSLEAHPSDEFQNSHVAVRTESGDWLGVSEEFLTHAVALLSSTAGEACKQRLHQLAASMMSTSDQVQLTLRREDLDLVIRCCASLIDLTKGMVAALAVMPQASEMMQAAVKQVVELVSELPPVLDTLREQRDGAGGWAP